jgi:hypothetical protein
VLIKRPNESDSLLRVIGNPPGTHPMVEMARVRRDKPVQPGVFLSYLPSRQELARHTHGIPYGYSGEASCHPFQ